MASLDATKASRSTVVRQRVTARWTVSWVRYSNAREPSTALMPKDWRLAAASAAQSAAGTGVFRVVAFVAFGTGAGVMR